MVCNQSVSPLPDRLRKRDVHQRPEDPQLGKPTRQIANRSHSAMSLCRVTGLIGCTWDQVHLLHHLIVSEIRKMIGNELVVQRNESQPVLAIQSLQVLDLFLAEYALAVIDQNIRVGEISRAWQRWRRTFNRLGLSLSWRSRFVICFDGCHFAVSDANAKRFLLRF